MARRSNPLYGNAPRNVAYNSVASTGWSHTITAGVIYRPAADPRVQPSRSVIAVMLQTLAVAMSAVLVIVLLVKLNAATAQQAQFTLASYIW